MLAVKTVQPPGLKVQRELLELNTRALPEKLVPSDQLAKGLKAIKETKI